MVLTVRTWLRYCAPLTLTVDRRASCRSGGSRCAPVPRPTSSKRARSFARLAARRPARSRASCGCRRRRAGGACGRDRPGLVAMARASAGLRSLARGLVPWIDRDRGDRDRAGRARRSRPPAARAARADVRRAISSARHCPHPTPTAWPCRACEPDARSRLVVIGVVVLDLTIALRRAKPDRAQPRRQEARCRTAGAGRTFVRVVAARARRRLAGRSVCARRRVRQIPKVVSAARVSVGVVRDQHAWHRASARRARDRYQIACQPAASAPSTSARPRVADVNESRSGVAAEARRACSAKIRGSGFAIPTRPESTIASNSGASSISSSKSRETTLGVR